MQRPDLDLPDFHQKNKKSAFRFVDVVITILNDFAIDITEKEHPLTNPKKLRLIWVKSKLNIEIRMGGALRRPSLPP